MEDRGWLIGVGSHSTHAHGHGPQRELKEHGKAAGNSAGGPMTGGISGPRPAVVWPEKGAPMLDELEKLIDEMREPD